MESEPLLPKADDKVQKSHIGNILKANLVFVSFHLAVNIRNAFLNQYIYQRYVSQLQDNNTDVMQSNYSNKCFVNESDPVYKQHMQAEESSNNLQIIFSYFSTPLCLISSVFLGSYSDYMGRKILFVIPLLGETIRNALCTAIIYWDLDLEYMYIGEAVTGLTAGYNGVMLASYVYTADNTPPHASRTVGIAAVDFTTYFAAAVSQVGTGYFIEFTGFVLPSLTTAALTLLATLFVIVILPETVSSQNKAEPCMAPTKAIKNGFELYFSKKFGKKRTLFWIIVIVFFINYTSMAGTFNIDYMLMLNQPFCWSPEKIGYYNMASMLVRQFLGIIVIKLLQVCTSDEGIGIITTLTQAGSDVLHGFAYTDFMLYGTIFASGMATPYIPVIRSLMSKMAPSEIQGSLFAGQTVVGLIATTAGQTLFGFIYDATLSTNRGIVYYSCGGGHVLAAAILILFVCIAPRVLRETGKENVIRRDTSVQEETAFTSSEEKPAFTSSEEKPAFTSIEEKTASTSSEENTTFTSIEEKTQADDLSS